MTRNMKNNSNTQQETIQTTLRHVKKEQQLSYMTRNMKNKSNTQQERSKTTLRHDKKQEQLIVNAHKYFVTD